MYVVYLDLTGAFFNNMNQITQCVYDNDKGIARDEWTWAPFTNNPTQMLISVGSYIFGFIYLLQHHVFFGAAVPRVRDEDARAFSRTRDNVGGGILGDEETGDALNARARTGSGDSLLKQ